VTDAFPRALRRGQVVVFDERTRFTENYRLTGARARNRDEHGRFSTVGRTRPRLGSIRAGEWTERDATRDHRKARTWRRGGIVITPRRLYGRENVREVVSWFERVFRVSTSVPKTYVTRNCLPAPRKYDRNGRRRTAGNLVGPKSRSITAGLNWKVFIVVFVSRAARFPLVR